MNKLKEKLYVIIFETSTPGGRAFDVSLLIFISLSIILVMLESVSSIRSVYGAHLKLAEIIITVFFTLEYALRIYISKKPWHYIKSFFGMVDLLCILPLFIGFFLGGAHNLIVIRALRMLRIFRVLKFTRYSREGNHLLLALINARAKLTVFLAAIITLALIFGSIMYLVEGEEHGFTSIPQSIYWAVVTLTTVGYGDIAPQTDLGRFISSLVMIAGYAIIAIPTGIVGYELTQVGGPLHSSRTCEQCQHEGHEYDAKYCRVCAAELPSLRS